MTQTTPERQERKPNLSTPTPSQILTWLDQLQGLFSYLEGLCSGVGINIPEDKLEAARIAIPELKHYVQSYADLAKVTRERDVLLKAMLEIEDCDEVNFVKYVEKVDGIAIDALAGRNK